MSAAATAGAPPASADRPRGAFILLEGVDRCGKSTQCARLLQHLQQRGVPCQAMRFPDRTTTIGATINAYLEGKTELDDRAIHLLFSANRWEAVGAIRRLLQEGTTLVVDRYAFSGVAFSAAKPGMSLEWCKVPDAGLPRPDVVLLLDMPVEVAATRGSYGAERYEKLDMQRRVQQNYHALRDASWHVLDASQAPDAVHESIVEVVEREVARVAGTEVLPLWPELAGNPREA